jgi:hypothetical protein
MNYFGCSIATFSQDEPVNRMLKIQRSGESRVTFKLSGRIETTDIDELRQLLDSERAGEQLVLDLADVTLVNQEAINFLSSCELYGIKVEPCPAYVREWIEQVKARTKPQGQ